MGSAAPRWARHCRKCDKCVAGFDHHCLWLNTCVGRRNYHRWLLFLLLLCCWSLGGVELEECGALGVTGGSWLKHVFVSASNILVRIAGVSWIPRKECWGRCFWGCSGVWLCHANWMFSCNVASSGSYYFLLLRFLIFYGNLQHQAPDFTSVSPVFGRYTYYLIYLIFHDPLSRSLQVIVICKDNHWLNR